MVIYTRIGSHKMPNHVTTIVKVSEKVIQEIITLDDMNEERFDFNTVIPMPDHIYTGDLGQAEREKYGKNNWYDWSSENWGTKWNSYSYHKETEGMFSFETAWRHPEVIMEKLSEKYPDEVFTIVYANEDTGHDCGAYVLKDGERIKESLIDGGGETLDYEFSWQVRAGESYVDILKEDYQYVKEQIDNEKFTYSTREELEEELEEKQTEINVFEEELNHIKKTNPSINFSDPFDYLNIS